MAKTLVVYYSRTGLTRKVAGAITRALGADSEEIIDCADRKGITGFWNAGKEAHKKISAQIKPLQRNPSDYELVIIGTPVWAFTMSCAARAFIEGNKGNCKSVAFFCTTGGTSGEKTLREMAELSGLPSAAGLVLTSSEAAKGTFEEKLGSFIKSLRDV